jgi:translation initiation factor IF-1
VQGALGAGFGGGANPFTAAAGVGGGGKRGQGFTVNLPAGENDVLRALNATGGLPGLDARNEVVIIRGGKNYCDATDEARRTVRIPLRVYPDQAITIREDDIILRDGDVVSIEARDNDVFYTAGLVGTTVYPLPRDVDLNIIQAIAVIRGPLVNGSFSQSAFSSSAVNGGIGNPNASLCSVLRQTSDNRQFEIRVDLNKALRDPRERILIQPGDIVVVQERPGEALTRYLTSTFRFGTAFNLLTRPDATIGLGASLP